MKLRPTHLSPRQSPSPNLSLLPGQSLLACGAVSYGLHTELLLGGEGGVASYIQVTLLLLSILLLLTTLILLLHLFLLLFMLLLQDPRGEFLLQDSTTCTSLPPLLLPSTNLPTMDLLLALKEGRETSVSSLLLLTQVGRSRIQRSLSSSRRKVSSKSSSSSRQLPLPSWPLVQAAQSVLTFSRWSLPPCSTGRGSPWGQGADMPSFHALLHSFPSPPSLFPSRDLSSSSEREAG